LEAIDNLVYGDKSIHKKVRNAFGGGSWSHPKIVKFYNLKFDLRHIRPN